MPRPKCPPIAADIITEIGDKVVLIERRNFPLGWAIPGGFVDFGETVEAAAVREAREEISLIKLTVARTLQRVLDRAIQGLGGLGMTGNVDGMLLHSVDYLDLFSTVIIAWQWLLQAAVAKEKLSTGTEPRAFYEGKGLAAQYWIKTELPRVDHLANLCRSGEDSYARMNPAWF